jgi:hypothetical protein
MTKLGGREELRLPERLLPHRADRTRPKAEAPKSDREGPRATFPAKPGRPQPKPYSKFAAKTKKRDGAGC